MKKRKLTTDNNNNNFTFIDGSNSSSSISDNRKFVIVVGRAVVAESVGIIQTSDCCLIDVLHVESFWLGTTTTMIKR